MHTNLMVAAACYFYTFVFFMLGQKLFSLIIFTGKRCEQIDFNGAKKSQKIMMTTMTTMMTTMILTLLPEAPQDTLSISERTHPTVPSPPQAGNESFVTFTNSI